MVSVSVVAALFGTHDSGFQNASFPNSTNATEKETDYQTWAGILLGFLILASGHYFKLREARRADRAEAREIADRRHGGNDTQ